MRFSIPIWAKRRKPCIQIGFQRAAYAIASLSATVCLVSRRVGADFRLARHPLGICAPSVAVRISDTSKRTGHPGGASDDRLL